MTRRNLSIPSLLVGILIAVVAGCTGASRLDTQDAGRTLVYRPGEPNFDLEVIARWTGREPGIDIYLGIPHISLIFTRGPQRFVGQYEVLTRIRDRRGSRDLVREEVWTDSVSVLDYESTQRFEAIHVQRRFDLQPGEYLVEVTLRDLNSAKTAVRRQGLDLFDLDLELPAMSQIQVEARKGDAPFTPLVALHIPSNLDSLRAHVAVYNATEAVNVQMSLVRFQSDVAVASPPYWLQPMSGSLTYRGVNYSANRADTVQATRRRIADVDWQVDIEFDLPQLETGIYRLDIEAVNDDGSVALKERRDLAIRGPEFPRVVTLEQLVEALSYIAYDREIRNINEAETAEEKRKRFDEFWGSLVSNRQVAHNLLRTYYARVEEANLYFTGHKEGWKTDRGMVYIVMGAPMYVEYMFDTEVWYYTYTERDQSLVFQFERVRPHGADATFQNYLLVRRPYYERTWTRAIDRWRSGQAM